MVRGFNDLQLDSSGNCFCVNYVRKIEVKNSTKIIKQIKVEVFCYNMVANVLEIKNDPDMTSQITAASKTAGNAMGKDMDRNGYKYEI